MTAGSSQAKQFGVVVVALFVTLCRVRGEELPPVPKNYFNDYAGVTSQSTQHALNKRLAKFDKVTSNQIVVAVFPKMESTLSLDDYTLRVANAWGVGQRGKNTRARAGVTLFVFVQDRTMRIQVSHRLTSLLTDALCKQIIDDQLGPHFQRGDFDGGLTAGVDAMLKIAARSDHPGTK
jgi:uncharacterized protein